MKKRKYHHWGVTPKEAVAIQRKLAGEADTTTPLGKVNTLAAVDVSYQASTNTLYAAIIIVNMKDLMVIDRVGAQGMANFPYVPGLLSFREIPILMEAFQSVKKHIDVILCDGQGIAHPRGIGIATHLGVLLGIPTVGCAKSKLCGKYDDPDFERGSTTPLTYYGKQIGTVVRTRANVKPVFVSPGHLCDMASAVNLVLDTVSRYRLPDPIRAAHKYSNELRLGDLALKSS